MTFVPSISP